MISIQPISGGTIKDFRWQIEVTLKNDRDMISVYTQTLCMFQSDLILPKQKQMLSQQCFLVLSQNPFNTFNMQHNRMYHFVFGESLGNALY